MSAQRLTGTEPRSDSQPTTDRPTATTPAARPPTAQVPFTFRYGDRTRLRNLVGEDNGVVSVVDPFALDRR